MEDSYLNRLYETFGKEAVDASWNSEPAQIKAIETEYDGHLFRSRLEARWAVFFHNFGIKYIYEFEGFKTDIGDGEYSYYLPDFYLPEYDKYVEVKGYDEALKKDSEKVAYSIDYCSTPVSNGLVIVGDIPNPGKIVWGNIPMFTYLYWHKGIVREHAAFIDHGFKKAVFGNESILNAMYSYTKDYSSDNKIPDGSTTVCEWTREGLRSFGEDYLDKLKEAYRIAKQARFEHGMKGDK